MATNTLLHPNDIPQLRPFILPNVRPTGKDLGNGAYGSVIEVEIPGALCAAKVIHDLLLRFGSAQDVRNITTKFVQECQLMSTLRHPNIVKFVGVCSLQGSRIPVLVMELLMTSLHDLLESRPRIPLSLKCSFLVDVGRGITFLHGHSPPLIHRDLSAKNVLLTADLVCKIADLGVARIVPSQQIATMTKAPGTGIYMPPEALEDRSRYDMSIDVFSLGVLAIFTLTQTFPEKLLAPTFQDTSRRLLGRSELERRNEYVIQIKRQLRPNHPLLTMIENCLENAPQDRPQIRRVMQLLEQATTETPGNYVNMSKLDLMLMIEGDVKQREKIQLQQQNQELRRQVAERDELVHRELAQAQQQLRQLGESSRREIGALERQNRTLRQQEQSSRREIDNLKQGLQSSESLVADFQKSLQLKDSELETLREKIDTYEDDSPGFEGGLPDDWEPMIVSLRVIDLAATSEGYTFVRAEFHRTMSTYTSIIKIQRVQNPTLYREYAAKKERLDVVNPKGTQNERWLFHGTKESAIPLINKTNFNRSFRGQNATMYGQGCYFARDASNSNGYAQPDPQGVKRMYVVRVLTGQYTTGSNAMIVAPAKDPNDPAVLFDSVVDSIYNPSIYVVFYDTDAYPEYLITYR